MKITVEITDRFVMWVLAIITAILWLITIYGAFQTQYVYYGPTTTVYYGPWYARTWHIYRAVTVEGPFYEGYVTNLAWIFLLTVAMAFTGFTLLFWKFDLMEVDKC